MVADDAVLFREGLSRVLADAGFEVTAQVVRRADPVAPGSRTRPRCASSTSGCPRPHHRGARYGSTVRGSHPGVGVLVLSAHSEPDFALALIEERARGAGYLLKERVADLSEFTDAVRTGGRGWTGDRSVGGGGAGRTSPDS